MSIKKIAIYLPQYHAIPENDGAWGEGFTEWTNVKKAKPLFEGHYQPHMPHESVGYYDLSDAGVLIKQAAMAKEHGIYGFAYYHYWFNGKLLLHDPLERMLSTGKPDFPFCYIWANENWTRRWDGADDEIIIKQEYSFEDDRQHIRFLCEKVFNDKRYITIDGKPLFLVYRTELFPDIIRTVEIWREEAKNHGFKDLYLVRVENFAKDVLPEEIDFDAAMEFAPDWQCTDEEPERVGNKKLFDYATVVYNMVGKHRPYKYFHCVFPGWDNTPRRGDLSGSIFINNDLPLFKHFIETQLMSTMEKFSNPDEQLLFINAWNEWAEGCHIEPDEKNGLRYLDICRDAVPRKEDDFNRYCFNQIDSLSKKNKALEKELEEEQQKYNLLLNSFYYRTGRKFISKLRTLKKRAGF